MAAVKQAKQKRSRKPQAKCFVDGCGNRPGRRGLCRRHMAQAMSAVDRGEISEQKLIDDGKLLPREKPGRPKSVPFWAKGK